MITVSVLEDRKKAEEIFLQNGAEFTENSGCMLALCGGEVIGYSLYLLDGEKIVVYKISPENDLMLADGILRGTLHLASRRKINSAFYTDNEKMFEKLGFIKDKTQKALDMSLLSKDCSCKKTALNAEN